MEVNMNKMGEEGAEKTYPSRASSYVEGKERT